MKKSIIIIPVAICALAILAVSCGRGDIKATGAVVGEVLAEDIVELRSDQIKLAGIETGSVEKRSMGCYGCPSEPGYSKHANGRLY
jgi:hypothetical protein